MRRLVILFSTYLLLSCSTEPIPIELGSDGCAYCKMTIVDGKFGAELVTSKGKVFKFDALECLINHSKANPGEDDDHYYVIDYMSGDWVEIQNAFYVRSKKFPSPMGQYITSVTSMESAMDLLDDGQGVIQTWDELINNFDVTNLEGF